MHVSTLKFLLALCEILISTTVVNLTIFAIFSDSIGITYARLTTYPVLQVLEMVRSSRLTRMFCVFEQSRDRIIRTKPVTLS